MCERDAIPSEVIHLVGAGEPNRQSSEPLNAVLACAGFFVSGTALET